MNKTYNITALVFILITTVIAGLSLLGIWDILADQVIARTLLTITLLVVISLVVGYAYQYINPFDHTDESNDTPWPVFTALRKSFLSLLIASVFVLGLVGVLSIWEIISEENIFKVFSSIAVLSISSGIITVVCLNRERHERFTKFFNTSNVSTETAVVGVLLLAYALFWFL